MKNTLIVNTSGNTLSNQNDGTNRLIINDVTIPESDWIGSGNYTYGNITIAKAKSNSGNWMLIKEADDEYYFDRVFPEISQNMLCYKSGDVVSSTLYAAGYVTNSKQNIRFVIPLIKPILNSSLDGFGTIRFTKFDLTLRQNDVYPFGSGSAASNALNYIESATISESGIRIALTNTWNNSSSMINNDAIGIYLVYTFEVLDS